MILIADSGSTKTDWRLVKDNNEITSFSTIGFNPYFIDSDSINKELNKSELIKIRDEELQVFFYGAGCSSDVNKDLINFSLKIFFANSEIQVHHDMLAAARAACGNQNGIVGILGTGSNSCVYDGENIIENIAALGYVLGDYGSGADIGKTFLKAFLEKELPDELHQAFMKSRKLSITDILDSVYKKNLPNRFLASFNIFVFENINHPYLSELVKKRMELFFEKNICKYTNYKEHKLNLIGSIAFVYKDILSEVALNYHIEIGKLIKQPIEELVKFHVNTKKY